MPTRPSALTTRRRAATELEIAGAAASLFARSGLAETTVEQIAEAAGVSLRTFYRYFPRKQDALVPLLRVGAEEWQAHLAGLSPDDDLAATVDAVLGRVLNPVSAREERHPGLTRGLLRIVLDDADLRRVWDAVNNDSERDLVPVLAAATHADPVTSRLLASACSQSVRLALETWCAPDAPSGVTPTELARDCFARLTHWH